MSAEAQGEPVRLLHWNVHSWIDPETGKSNADAAMALITEHEPDVVSLVEVDQIWSEPSILARVATETGYVAIFDTVFEYGTDAPTGGFGNAILTRLPVLSVNRRQLTWPTTVFDGTEPSEQRSVLLVTVQTPAGTKICVGSTHVPRSNLAARVAALNRLHALFMNPTMPWIICGDFNTEASTWLDPQGSVSCAPNSEHPTYPTTRPTESIDYAVTGSQVSLSAEVLSCSGSDHLPILVRADIKDS